ncbi:MAG: response regulator [Acidobacteriota bacterium]
MAVGKRQIRQLAQAQKMEAIARVTGGVAHNFNNLLAGIVGFCDLASHSESSDDRALYLEKIANSAHLASDQVKKLLAFSQQQLLDCRPVLLDPIVSAAARQLLPEVPDTVEVEVDLRAGPDAVRVDPNQAEAILAQLAANALKAMPEGGRLTFKTRELTLDHLSPAHFGIHRGRYVLLEVRDTGYGIDESSYEKIFEPYFSTKANLNGTGLGLSMVYGWVKQSGGQIRVESQPGRGSVFRVYLPRTAVAQEPRASNQQPAESAIRQVEHQRRPGTLLLAEDDPTMQLVLRAFLQQRNWHVLAAADGVAAVELAQQHDGPIDLLLTDIVMPRMDGLELAQTIKADRPETKIVFISGYTQDRETLSELLGGARDIDFLKKPFRHEQLQRKLEQLVALDETSIATPQAAA